MAITYQTPGDLATTTSGNLSVPYPASVANGDILLLVIAATDNVTASASGFTLKLGTNNGTGLRSEYLWKRADGTETGSLTVTRTSGQAAVARMHRFTGVIGAGDPFTAAGSANASSATITASTITPTANNSMVLFGGVTLTSATQASYSGTSPTFTEQVDAATELRPYYVNATAANSAASTTAISVTIPTGTATNDVVFVSFVIRSTTGTVTVPTGWTQQGAGVSDGSTGIMRTLWAVAGSNGVTSGATVNFTISGGKASAVAVTIRNANTSTPIQQYTTNTVTTAGTVVTPANVTPGAAGTFILAFAHKSAEATSYSAASGYTVRASGGATTGGTAATRSGSLVATRDSAYVASGASTAAVALTLGGTTGRLMGAHVAIAGVNASANALSMALATGLQTTAAATGSRTSTATATADAGTSYSASALNIGSLLALTPPATVTVSTAADAVLVGPSVSDLVESFATSGYTTAFPNTVGTVSRRASTLRLTTTSGTGTSALYTGQLYTMADGTLGVEMLPNQTPVDSGRALTWAWRRSATYNDITKTAIEVKVSGTTLTFTVRNDSGTSVYTNSTTYSFTNHRFLRVVHSTSGGNVKLQRGTPTYDGLGGMTWTDVFDSTGTSLAACNFTGVGCVSLMCVDSLGTSDVFKMLIGGVNSWPTATAVASSVTQDFSSLPSSPFVNTTKGAGGIAGESITVSGGQGVYTCASSNVESWVLTTRPHVDLFGSSVFVEIVDFARQADSSTENTNTIFGLQDDSADAPAGVQTRVGNSVTSTPVLAWYEEGAATISAWSATTHKYLRLRWDATDLLLHLDTSPDRTTWTERGTSLPGELYSDVSIILQADFGQATAGALEFPAKFDNLNISAALTSTKTASADAVLKKTQSVTPAANAVLQKTGNVVTTSANAVLQKTGNVATATADAVLKKTQSATTSANAVLQKLANTVTTSANAVLQKTGNVVTTSADAVLKKAQSATATADAVLQKALSKTASADAVLQKTGTVVTASANAVLAKTQSSATSADAVLQKTQLLTTSANAVLQKAGNVVTTSADAVLQKTQTLATAADAILRKAATIATAADAVLKKSQSATATADAVLKKTQTLSVSADAVLLAGGALTASADAVLQKTQTLTTGATAVFRRTQTTSTSADAVLQTAQTLSTSANAVLQKTQTVTSSADAVLQQVGVTLSTGADAVLLAGGALTASADAVLLKTQTVSTGADAVLTQGARPWAAVILIC